MSGRVEQAELEALRELNDRVAIRRAQVAVGQAEFELAVTKAFVKHQYSLQTHAVCLHCGCFNARGRACACVGVPVGAPVGAQE